jgi:phosphopantothenoylcysteine synthetase/decarboxylase
MKILITSGGCKVPIDDVRHIGNFSSGRYGRELAEAFLDAEHEVLFFYEHGSTCPSFNRRGGGYNNLSRFIYKNYDEYLSVKDLIKREQPDVIISAAAISDYIVDKTEGKISSSEDELVIRLQKGEKVIKSFRELSPNSIIVGFKLLVGPTSEQKELAIEKVFSSGVDFVVYNDLLELRKGNTERQLFCNFDGGKHSREFTDPSYLVKFVDAYLKPHFTL